MWQTQVFVQLKELRASLKCAHPLIPYHPEATKILAMRACASMKPCMGEIDDPRTTVPSHDEITIFCQKSMIDTSEMKIRGHSHLFSPIDVMTLLVSLVSFRSIEALRDLLELLRVPRS